MLWMAKHFLAANYPIIGFEVRVYRSETCFMSKTLLISSKCNSIGLSILAGETFNVGGGVELSSSLLELTEWCEKLTGQSIPIQSDPETRPGDIPWFITDSRRIQIHSGWKPKRSLESIFRKSIIGYIRIRINSAPSFLKLFINFIS